MPGLFFRKEQESEEKADVPQRLKGNKADAVFQGVIRRLHSDEVGEREQAEQELRAILEYDTRTVEKYRRWRNFIMPGYAALVAFACFMLTLHLPLLGIIALFDLMSFGGLAIAFLIMGIHRRAGRRLARLDDLRAIGPLVDALADSTYFFPSQEIVAALIRLLPRMKANDASLLDTHQRKTLYKFLRKDIFASGPAMFGGVDFKIAILKALEQIGDSGAIPYVQGVVNSRNGKIRAAAQECLSYLQQRVKGTEQTLLRPSIEEATASALLRPSEASQETDPQTLLRANTQEETEIEDL